MNLSVEPVELPAIMPWRDMYRREMNCQIVHDSLHGRPGWTCHFALHVEEGVVGYGAVVTGGPWKGASTAFELYVAPPYRLYLLDLFRLFVEASGVVFIEGQTNDPILSAAMHAHATQVTTESTLFRDKHATLLSPTGAGFRRASAGDRPQMREYELDVDAKWVVDLNGAPVAAGDILFHYNRPYGDIYMKVAGPFRRRGLGSYMVQELKRICYEQGSVPGARCNPSNTASRKTLLRAGFEQCGFILKGRISI